MKRRAHDRTNLPVEERLRGPARQVADLKAQGAIINFEVFPDTELNTASQIAPGKVYWRIRFTDVPPAENPNFLFEVTDQWMTEVPEAA